VTGRRLTVRRETWPIRGSFRIARGAKSEAEVVVAEIAAGARTGRGECVPYARYGESIASVTAQIASLAAEIEQGLDRAALQPRLPAGAARNALDCALIDLGAKEAGKPAHVLLGLPPPIPVRTAFTLSVDSPDAMGTAAAKATGKGYRLLKLKLAGTGDLARVHAVRAAAPAATLILDANEGLSFDALTEFVPALAPLRVALIEQPLKAAEDGALSGFKSPIPLCADESCHTRLDLPRLAGRYSHINIKLDKTGGLTEAVALACEARALGFGLMVGCMVSTSLSMAPASLLGGLADFVDLDGPLLLARDREPSIRYDGDLLTPPAAGLWG
jgi:L-alanine-DL-glutamate epimerase-like enolase superfamily enzyme